MLNFLVYLQALVKHLLVDHYHAPSSFNLIFQNLSWAFVYSHRLSPGLLYISFDICHIFPAHSLLISETLAYLVPDAVRASPRPSHFLYNRPRPLPSSLNLGPPNSHRNLSFHQSAFSLFTVKSTFCFRITDR